jgi:threonine synthase
MDRLRETFACGYATDAETSATIRNAWESEQVLIDPHTAVGKCVLDRFEADGRQRVCLSTANPYKFSADVLAALGTDTAGMDGFACMDALQQLTGVAAPAQLSGLRTAPVLHPDVCDQAQMSDFVEAACARVFS